MSEVRWLLILSDIHFDEIHLNVVFVLYASQSDDSDIWDDTALIKAYDKAVASFKV